MLRELCPDTTADGTTKSSRCEPRHTPATCSFLSRHDEAANTSQRITQRSVSGPLRLPDLRMVIVTDGRQPGTLHVDDVMQAGESRHHRQLMDLQSRLSCDDPINIQFTSVTFHVAPLAHLLCNFH